MLVNPKPQTPLKGVEFGVQGSGLLTLRVEKGDPVYTLALKNSSITTLGPKYILSLRVQGSKY